jgi:RNA polymerase primary sigma factor
MLEYDTWKQSPTPQNLAPLMQALDPVINAEIQRFTGPKPLLRGRARALAVKAIRSYDPTAGAQLKSWVVTQLQPLSRYTHQLKPVHAPEVAIRQAAEVNRQRQELSEELGYEPSVEELADKTGLSVKRVNYVQKIVRPTIAEGSMSESAEEDNTPTAPGVSQLHKLTVAEEAVFDSLSPRDQMIFDWKTGKHGKVQLSNQEIAKRLGVTPALISQRSQQIALQIHELHERGIL